MVQAVATTTDLFRLEAMAVGAFSAVELPSPGSGAAARAALSAIAGRLQDLDPDGDASEKLRAILTLSGDLGG